MTSYSSNWFTLFLLFVYLFISFFFNLGDPFNALASTVLPRSQGGKKPYIKHKTNIKDLHLQDKILKYNLKIK